MNLSELQMNYFELFKNIMFEIMFLRLHIRCYARLSTPFYLLYDNLFCTSCDFCLETSRNSCVKNKASLAITLCKQFILCSPNLNLCILHLLNMKKFCSVGFIFVSLVVYFFIVGFFKHTWRIIHSWGSSSAKFFLLSQLL